VFGRNVSFLKLQASVCINSPDMLYQFERFIVVKTAERVQEISRQRCTGCISGHSLDQLHQCMSISLKEKIGIFLPRVKAEALSKVENLLYMYKQNAWISEEQAFIEAGKNFIKKLNVDDLLDRRYVNEDTVMEHPYNTTWHLDQNVVGETIEAITQPLPPILPLDPAAENQQIAPISIKKNPKKRKTPDCSL